MQVLFLACVVLLSLVTEVQGLCGSVFQMAFSHLLMWILAIGGLNEHHEFEASVGYIMKLPRKQNWNTPNQNCVSHQNFSVY